MATAKQLASLKKARAALKKKRAAGNRVAKKPIKKTVRKKPIKKTVRKKPAKKVVRKKSAKKLRSINYYEVFLAKGATGKRYYAHASGNSWKFETDKPKPLTKTQRDKVINFIKRRMSTISGFSLYENIKKKP